MKKTLGILFIICGILFIVNGILFLCTIFIAHSSPYLIYFNTSGYTISILVAAICLTFAYYLIAAGRQLLSRRDSA